MSLTFRSSLKLSNSGSRTERALSRSTSIKKNEGPTEVCIGKLKETRSQGKLENWTNIIPTVSIGNNKIQSSRSSFCLGSLSAHDKVLTEGLNLFQENQQKV